MAVETDAALTQLGTGAWSILHILALTYCSIPIVPHAMGSAFFAPSVDFSCRPPTAASHHHHNSTASTTTTTSTSSPDAMYSSATFTTTTPLPAALSHGNTYKDKCTYNISGEAEGWREGTNVGLEKEEELAKCTEWDFDNATFTSTVTSEFQLVCDRSYLRTTYQSIYMFGVFVGSPINGFLSDKYGRKRVLVLGTILYLVVAPGSSWLTQFPTLLLSRFLLGMMHAVLSFGSFILAVEIAEPRYRTVVGIATMLGWAGGLMIYGWFAYLVRSWRLLQLVSSLPMLPFLPVLWVMDESPRWLVVKGRREEALKVFRRVARWHEVPLNPDDELLSLTDQTPSPVTEGKRTFRATLRNTMEEVLVLYRTPRLRTITLLLYITYLVSSMVYYGLSLSGGSLSDNPFVYMVLSGLMEVPAYTLLIPVIERAGRRTPGFSCFLFCGVALFSLAVIPKRYNWLVVLMAMLGKVAIAGAFQIIIFQSSELFPTEVRSRGVGTSFMMSRIGAIVSPFILDFMGSRHSWAPSVVFGSASLLAAAVTLLLPETLGLALPDTIADLETRQVAVKKHSWYRSLVRRNKDQEEGATTTKKEGSSVHTC